MLEESPQRRWLYFGIEDISVSLIDLNSIVISPRDGPFDIMCDLPIIASQKLRFILDFLGGETMGESL